MRMQFPLFFLAVAAFLLTASAASAVCNPRSTPGGCINAVDKSCGQLGETTMDGDQKNLIACLNNESGIPVWKAMTAGNAGAKAGYCMQDWGGKSNYGSIAPAYFDSTPVACVGGDPDRHAATVGSGCHVGCQCPAGWSLVWTGTCDFGWCYATTSTGQLYFYDCIKN
ncbi:MAG: hypothetical protein PHY92_05040 [Alphaproteobacteria bacterium]|nr:hypothetical protein [Alphaproteobacteria bacterium]